MSKNTVSTMWASPSEVNPFLPLANRELIQDGIYEAINLCHYQAVSCGWWHANEKPKELNFGERIALIHSELSETLEAFRKNLMCDKPGLEHFTGVEEELADTVIRIFDLAGALSIDLAHAILAKLEYNAIRPDHKPEARAADGGKKF